MSDKDSKTLLTLDLPYNRTIELTRVYAIADSANPSDEYDGLTISVGHRDDLGTKYAYIKTVEQLESLIVSLIEARINWDSRG